MKPWTRAIRSLVILPPEEGSKKRVNNFRLCKEVAREGLNQSPYIGVKWAKDDSQVRALLDSGADWSCIDVSTLNPEEREALDPPKAAGRGVTGEEISIVGEVWRDLKLGDLLVKNQRFVVVEDMITAVILGADFWARLPPMLLDFRNRSLSIPELGVKTEMFGSDRAESNDENKPNTDDERRVTVIGDWVIPRMSETFVTCRVKNMRLGHSYILEPDAGDDTKMKAPYCILQKHSLQEEELLSIRVANVSDTEETLREGRTLGQLSPTQEILHTAGERFKRPAVERLPRSLPINGLGIEIGQGLDEKQRAQLEKILRENSQVFYNGGELPIVKVGVEHTINVKPESAPEASRPRRLGSLEEVEVRKEMEKLKKMGVIRPSNSPWAAPIVCARKQDGSLRLAIDYRKLNEISLPATLHPIPLIEDLLDRLSAAKFFSVLDAKSGYHQMPLCKEDSKASAFVVPWGQFEWCDRTPFGLKGAGYSFQRMMARILGASNFTEALCYLDDILIWGTTWEEHTDRLERVLQKVKAAGLALSPEKCRFGVREVMYLGSVIKEGMISISEQRVQDLRAIPTPTTVRELRRALGAFVFIQRWLPGVAEIAKPLHDGVKGKPHTKLAWTVEMNRAFNKLKSLVANAIALKIPDQDKDFTLITDCSDYGAGAVLAQEDEREDLVPVAFFHHTLSEAERKYGTTEKELLAMIAAIKKFRVYLSRKFTLITDHTALKWLKSLNPHDEKGRRGRWIEFIQQYEFQVIHKSGKSPEMAMADYLSRLPSKKDLVNMMRKTDEMEKQLKVDKKEEEPKVGAVRDDDGHNKVADAAAAQVKLELFSLDQLKQGQGDDPVWSQVRDCIERNVLTQEKLEEIGGGSTESRIPGKKHDRLFIDARGILMLGFNGGRKPKGKGTTGVKTKNRLVVPRSLVPTVMRLVHDAPVGAHMGQDRTWHRARDSFYWEGMKAELDRYIHLCEECGRNKHSTHPNVAPFQITDLPMKTNEKIQMDFAGPFPRASTHEHRYILQIQDILSRFVMMIPCKDDTAATAARIFKENWGSIFGFSTTLQTDRGTHFTSEVFEALCAVAGVRHNLGAPKHAESQGQVERQNQLMAQIRCVCENDVELWPEAIHSVVLSHNMAKNATTGVAPMEMMTGQEVRSPENAWLVPQDREPGNGNEKSHAEMILRRKKERIEELTSRATARVMLAQQKRRDARKTRGRQYEVGDQVRIKLDSYEVKKRGKKLAFRYSKPHVVTRKLGEGWTYRLSPRDGPGREKTRHFNELKSYCRRDVRAEEDGDTDYDTAPEQFPEVSKDDRTSKRKVPVAVQSERERKALPPRKKVLQPPQERKERHIDQQDHFVRRSSRTQRKPSRLVLQTHGQSHTESEDTTQISMSDESEESDVEVDDEYIPEELTDMSDS